MSGEVGINAQRQCLEIGRKVLNHSICIYKHPLYSRIREVLEKEYLSHVLPSRWGGEVRQRTFKAMGKQQHMKFTGERDSLRQLGLRLESTFLLSFP